MKLTSFFAKRKALNSDTILPSCLFYSSLPKAVYLNTLFSFIFITCFLPAANAAQSTKKPVRWFEMEVILFSQLGDKTSLNEDFTNETSLPTYRGIRELLTEYIQPDISNLQRQLPFCASPLSLTSYHKNKSVTAITFETLNEQLTKQFQQNLTYPVNVESLIKQVITQRSTLSASNFNNTEGSQNGQSFDINNAQSFESIKQANLNAKSHENIIPKIDNTITTNLDTNVEANQEMIKLADYNYEPITFSKQLCQLSNQDKTALQQALPYFDENAIKIERIPRTINGIEKLASNEPYLISQSSLQLNDIIKKLRSSREFKPLLHVGWRQAEPAINAKRSIPMHLFAGENLLANYQQQLEQFKQEQALAQKQEEILQAALGTEQVNAFTSSAADNERQLNSIISSLDDVPENTIDLVAQLDELAASHQLTDIEKAVNIPLEAPIKPSQNWSIDGLFNVHLDHYLYITADFNIANMTLAQQASQQLVTGEYQPIKSIRFSQNKRVISKEIHYFDHPYMGMIVQIRRYKRPTAEELAQLKAELTAFTNTEQE